MAHEKTATSAARQRHPGDAQALAGGGAERPAGASGQGRDARATCARCKRGSNEHSVSFGHWAFLRILWERDGLNQRELSDQAGVMEPTTFSAIQAMEKLGYVTRVQRPDNRTNGLHPSHAQGPAAEKQAGSARRGGQQHRHPRHQGGRRGDHAADAARHSRQSRGRRTAILKPAAENSCQLHRAGPFSRESAARHRRGLAAPPRWPTAHCRSSPGRGREAPPPQAAPAVRRSVRRSRLHPRRVARDTATAGVAGSRPCAIAAAANAPSVFTGM